jgi:regulator of sigma E protease
MGLKVREFMFGLPGPRVLSLKWGETEYGVTALPFGGYVRFAGVESELQTEEDEEDRNTPPERKYDTQPRWKKAIIMVAGPLMNIILCVVLVAVMLMFQGMPKDPASGGSNILGRVSKSSPAQKVGLKEGDRVISVDGKKVKTWNGLVSGLKSKPGKQVTIVVDRNGKTLTLLPTLDKKNGKGFLGISIGFKQLNPFAAAWQGLVTTWLIVKFMVVTLYTVITTNLGLLVKDSAGPVRIVSESAKIAQESFWQFIWFMAIISVNIGIVNLLPIPPLDGGRLAILGIEGIKRGPVNQKLVYAVNAIGMALLLALMVYFVYADIAKIVAGTPFPGGG